MSDQEQLLVAATLEEVAIGDRFTKVPLHVTIMPWLEIDDIHVGSDLKHYISCTIVY